MKYLLVVLCVIPLLLYSQEDVNDFMQIEFRSDSKAYIVGSKKCADGYYVGNFDRTWSKKHFGQYICQIQFMVQYFSERSGGLKIFAEFENGKPVGKWLIKNQEDVLCGYLNIADGMLQGKSLFKCPDSPKRQLFMYENGVRISEIGYDSNGDTLFYYKMIDSELQRVIDFRQGERMMKTGWCDF